jgi:hypothetical protein
MSEIDWREIHGRLSSPDGMHVKVREGKFRYIDAREVMDRLDEVVGPEHWSTVFTVLDKDAAVVECRLTVHGVTKADAGYPNNPGSDFEKEPFKAAYSDALKRAAVHFGIGRFLYEDGPVQRQAPRQPAPPMPQAAAIPPKQAAPTLLPAEAATQARSALHERYDRLLTAAAGYGIPLTPWAVQPGWTDATLTEKGIALKAKVDEAKAKQGAAA